MRTIAMREMWTLKLRMCSHFTHQICELIRVTCPKYCIYICSPIIFIDHKPSSFTLITLDEVVFIYLQYRYSVNSLRNKEMLTQLRA